MYINTGEQRYTWRKLRCLLAKVAFPRQTGFGQSQCFRRLAAPAKFRWTGCCVGSFMCVLSTRVLVTARFHSTQQSPLGSLSWGSYSFENHSYTHEQMGLRFSHFQIKFCTMPQCRCLYQRDPGVKVVAEGAWMIRIAWIFTVRL